MFARARDLLNEDLDVVTLIQRLRFFEDALNKLLLPKEIATLRAVSKKKSLSPGPEEPSTQVRAATMPSLCNLDEVIEVDKSESSDQEKSGVVKDYSADMMVI